MRAPAQWVCIMRLKGRAPGVGLSGVGGHHGTTAARHTPVLNPSIPSVAELPGKNNPGHEVVCQGAVVEKVGAGVVEQGLVCLTLCVRHQCTARLLLRRNPGQSDDGLCNR